MFIKRDYKVITSLAIVRDLIINCRQIIVTIFIMIISPVRLTIVFVSFRRSGRMHAGDNREWSPVGTALRGENEAHSWDRISG